MEVEGSDVENFIKQEVNLVESREKVMRISCDAHVSNFCEKIKKTTHERFVISSLHTFIHSWNIILVQFQHSKQNKKKRSLKLSKKNFISFPILVSRSHSACNESNKQNRKLECLWIEFPPTKFFIFIPFSTKICENPICCVKIWHK